MDTKKRSNTTTATKPLPVLLSKENRDRLERLQDMWNCSLGEAVRRCIEDVYQRVEEERMIPRLDQIRDNQIQALESVVTLRSDLTDLRSRVEAIFPLMKSIEKDSDRQFADILKVMNPTAIRLLAFINTLQPATKERIEAEIQRLLAED